MCFYTTIIQSNPQSGKESMDYTPEHHVDMYKQADNKTGNMHQYIFIKAPLLALALSFVERYHSLEAKNATAAQNLTHL